jgi:Flp pilus assembly protein TadD
MKFISFLLAANILFSTPDDPLMKAASAMKAGLYRNALSHVVEAQNMDQTNPEVFRLKALLHEALDEPDEALSAWKNCLKHSRDELLIEEATVHIQSLTQE